MDKIPTREQFLNPILKALSTLGGSGTVKEIDDLVIAQMGIPEDLLQTPVSKDNPNGRKQVSYELAWSRTMLKHNGYITSSKRGVWALSDSSKVSVDEVNLKVPPIGAAEGDFVKEDWKSELKTFILDRLSPKEFEHLVQRLLRESGFENVVVTGRSGDGGIDGKCNHKINGILDSPVPFQCKRYKGSVSSEEVRNFKGALDGRSHMGLIITTGYFTKNAIEEAERGGTKSITLIDGDLLAEKLKELGLGVRVEMVEKVTIDPDWFSAL